MAVEYLPQDPRGQSAAEYKISAQNIWKSYNGLPVLSGMNLDVVKGEFVAVVGASGCGKSTFLRCLAGLEHPDRGEIQIDGMSVQRPAPQRTLIFQDHGLYPWRTVSQNVALGLEVARTPRRIVEEKVDAILETVGLSGFQHYFPHQLSGGMRQRASIARALVLDPDVLFMDEPYGALDAMTRLTMQNELLKLWEAREMTVILITHDIEEALFLADRVIVMSERPGRVQAIFSVDDARPRSRDGARIAQIRRRVLQTLGLDQ